MSLRTLLPLFALVACDGGGGDTDSATGGDSGETADSGETTDSNDTGDTGDTGQPQPTNAQAAGTWTLSSAGPTCEINLAGSWAGTPSTENELSFSLLLTAENRTLTCAFVAGQNGAFQCSDWAMTVPIANCTASFSLTSVGGTVSGGNATLTANAQLTSPNCGQALNCGPSQHTASGAITP